MRKNARTMSHRPHRVRQDKQEQDLFLALVSDALIGVVGGSLSLVGKATAASANAILGGVLATSLSLDAQHCPSC